MAIAWIYRDEYSKAGFRMLSGIDPDGRRSAASAIRNTIALILVSLVPFLQGVCGRIYLSSALILGGLFLVHAVRFAILLDIPSARRLFFSSILYLPVLLTFLVIDRTKEVPSPTSFPPSTSTFSVPLPTAVVLNFAAPPVSECGS
jgi:protoheme IX farnesyltransferase